MTVRERVNFFLQLIKVKKKVQPEAASRAFGDNNIITMPAPPAFYGKMLTERAASRMVFVLFYLFIPHRHRVID
jgi:hypothetical protein